MARGVPSTRISTHGAVGRKDRRAKAVHNCGKDTSPRFCTAFCDVGRVHRRPDRRWTPREAGALTPFRSAPRRDSPIPECKASKTTEETLLRCFGPWVGWAKSSIAAPPGDGHPGRRVPPPLFASQHRKIRKSRSTKCPKWRRRLSPIVLDCLLGGCVRPSTSRPAMGTRGGRVRHLAFSQCSTDKSRDPRVQSL